MFSQILNSNIHNRSMFNTNRDLYAYPQREDDNTQDDEGSNDDDY